MVKRTRGQGAIETFFSGAFTIIIVLVTVAVSFLCYLAVKHELEQTTSMYQQALLSEINKQLDLQRNAIEQLSLSALRNIRIISNNLRQKNAYERRQSHTDIEYYLANITYSAPVIHSICMYMDPPAGPSLLNAVHFYDIKLLEDYGWYNQRESNQIDDGDFFWTGAHTVQGSQGDIQVIGFARKISDCWPYNGMMIFNLKVSDIKGFIGTGGMSGTGGAIRSAYAEQSRTRMLFSPDKAIVASVGQQGADLNALLHDIVTEPSSTEVSGTRSNSKYLMVYDTSDSGWTLLEITAWNDIMRGNRRLVIMLTAIGLVAIAAASFLVFQLKTQYRKHNAAEMKALQAMINPHFLYNTLDQINWMAIEAGQNDISTALSLMGKMFRIGLSHGEALISIEHEIAHVSYYLELQKLRWKKRLEYHISIEPESAQDLIPRLILQPFVENSIIHGFHHRDRGMISLTIFKRNGTVVIVIHDNGVGIRPDWQAQTRIRKTNAGGYGLRNVIKRVELFSQRSDCVTIEGSPGNGTTVTLRLPVGMKSQG
jgi:two-component system sensor histidine kinase YesM